MSIYGEWTAATIASGEVESSAVDLGRDYDWLLIQIPAIEGGGKIRVKVAETTGGTYYNLGGNDVSLYEMTAFKNTPIGEDDTQEDAKENYETYNRADSIRLGGWRFVKVCTDNPTSEAWSIRVRGMRY